MYSFDVSAFRRGYTHTLAAVFEPIAPLSREDVIVYNHLSSDA